LKINKELNPLSVSIFLLLSGLWHEFFRIKNQQEKKKTLHLCVFARLKKHRKIQTLRLNAFAAEPDQAEQNSQKPQNSQNHEKNFVL
jgi:hypothetical protein